MHTILVEINSTLPFWAQGLVAIGALVGHNLDLREKVKQYEQEQKE